MSAAPWLVVIETPFRGDVERTFVDSTYLTRVCRAQFRGDLDVLLRGEGALLARSPDGPIDQDAWWGHAVSSGFEMLLAEGCSVFVESESLSELPGPSPLRAGVVSEPRARLAARWADYDSILFF